MVYEGRDRACGSRSNGELFSDLVDLLVPKDGLAGLLSAYVDASTRESGVFCVSGLAFGRDRGKKADRAWRSLWGDTVCHMTDLNARRPGTAFSDWSGDKAGAWLQESVKIVNQYCSFSVSISCELAEIDALAPSSAAPDSVQYLDGFQRAYAVCCHLVMHYLARLVREHGREPQIAYFFESGDRYQAGSQRFIAMAAEDERFREVYGYRAHAVANKVDVRLLETADIMAWEWAKQRDRIAEGRHVRPSLRTLLDPHGSGRWSDFDFASDSRRAVHLTGEPLVRFFDQIKARVLA